MAKQEPQHELRCVGCNKLLLKFTSKDLKLETKCPRGGCGVMTRLEVNPDEGAKIQRVRR